MGQTCPQCTPGKSELSNQVKSNPEPSTQEVLAGLVERVTFHNAENGFCVLRAKARGRRDQVTVVGHAATVSAGEWITASGEWVNDRTHGQQFKARFLYNAVIVVLEGEGAIGAEGKIVTAGDVAWLTRGDSGKASEVEIRATDKPLRALLYAGRPLHDVGRCARSLCHEHRGRD